jgi:hypothetical protein
VEKAVTLAEQMAGSSFSLLPDGYSVVRALDVADLDGGFFWRNCFAMICDCQAGECTLVVGKGGAAEVADPAYPEHAVYRAIRMNLLAPFEGVGFISAVSGAIARAGVNILAVSAYSFDYFLVKEEDLEKTLRALGAMGVRQEDRP